MSRAALLLAVALVVAPACGGDDDADDTPVVPVQGSGDTATGVDGDISIDSDAFAFEAAIPEQYGLRGGNLSPPLAWAVDVDGAVELVLLVDDADAPGDDPFVHWMVAGIDPASTGTGEGAVPPGAVEGTNGMGEVGYGGPAPPSGETHRYVFRLLALDAPSGLEEGFSRDDLQAVLDEHFLVSAEYTGTFAG